MEGGWGGGVKVGQDPHPPHTHTRTSLVLGLSLMGGTVVCERPLLVGQQLFPLLFNRQSNARMHMPQTCTRRTIFVG